MTLSVEKPLVCPVMGNPVKESSPAFEFAGMRMAICCGGCDAKLQKDPMKVMAEAAKKGWVVAEFAFDPISGNRIEMKKAEFKRDFNGVRYAFETEENADRFTKEPKTFTKLPKGESLVCPMMNVEIKSPLKASGFADFEGVRYYFCCGGCREAFGKNPKSQSEGIMPLQVRSLK